MLNGIIIAILLTATFNIPLLESRAEVFYNPAQFPVKERLQSLTLAQLEKIEREEAPTREETAKAKEDKEEYSYLGSSCVRFAHYLNEEVPLVDSQYFKQFKGCVPVIGGIIILKYNAKDGSGEIWHVATITSFEKNGFGAFESNFEKGKIGHRIIFFDDSHIEGFWKPANI